LTDPRGWLESRTPAPPAELRAAVEAALGASNATEPQPTSGLADAGTSRLAAALGSPGRVRTAAFDLLAADALVTYACEAALESEDPDGVLAALALRMVEAGDWR
jgi:hypothetical protein